MEKNYESIAELVKDPQFVKFVTEGIAELRRKRHNRPDPKPGFRYVRDWYDRMSEAGQMHISFFIDNIEDIWNKRSNLSSEVRSIIKQVCDVAFYKTMKYYESLEEPIPNNQEAVKEVVVAEDEFKD